MVLRLLQLVGSGILGGAAQVAVIAGTVVLVLMLIALAGFVYESLRGDGIRWPGDDEDTGAPEEVTRGSDDGIRGPV